MESTKIVVGVVHWKAKDKFLKEVKDREDMEMFTVTPENRNELHWTIVERAI
jgi:nucleoside-triphosphatase THEP1